MSKLTTMSTWGMSNPRLATSVATRMERDLLLNLFSDPSRFACQTRDEIITTVVDPVVE